MATKIIFIKPYFILLKFVEKALSRQSSPFSKINCQIYFAKKKCFENCERVAHTGPSPPNLQNPNPALAVSLSHPLPFCSHPLPFSGFTKTGLHLLPFSFFPLLSLFSLSLSFLFFFFFSLLFPSPFLPHLPDQIGRAHV